MFIILQTLSICRHAMQGDEQYEVPFEECKLAHAQ
jgi:hypothetical protein